LSPALPSLLTENAGLAFIGEEPWPIARLTPRQAKVFNDSRNPTSRPNSDVIHPFIGVESNRIKEYTQIDFPLHFTEQEAALYVEPFRQLHAAQKHTARAWWLSPHAQRDLRTAVARLERYLATTLLSAVPTWEWIDSQKLPDDSLLVIARDDDFAHGVLQSRFFNLWWHHYSSRLSPTEIATAFPFPWPPATLLSSLTRAQEEQRHAVARAARAGEQEPLDSAVTAAYGWLNDFTDEEFLARLKDLNRQRAT
jgi:hypothetical protein